uniref:Uncharacterized protein n=1 Tax=Oryza punctata TaxID=4537 RepID=A0A0E0LJB4_ORYPU
METDASGPPSKKLRPAALDTGEVPNPSPSPSPAPAADTESAANEPRKTDGGDDGHGVDCVSRLPDAILQEIISLLPTNDAARTQTLASRWCHLWRSAPLNLDHGHLPAADEANAGNLVSRILSLHRGPGRRFSIDALHLHLRRDTVDGWLRSTSLDNLQELEFYSPEYTRPRALLLPPPASTFRFSSTLRAATISQCSLPDETARSLHFPQLRQLQLQQIGVSDESLRRIIAGCPVLEGLLLSSIDGFHCLRIISPTIKNIGMRFISGELIIEDAPSLQSLLHLDLQTGLKLSVLSTPKLETLGCLNDHGWSSKLEFGSTVIKELRVVSLITAKHSVKVLAVSSYNVNLDVIVDLMRCFPCLEKLYIQWNTSGGQNLWRHKHQNLIKCPDNRLKTVVLANYNGAKSQINFVTFFVLNARMLESLRLMVDAYNYKEYFFIEQHWLLEMDNRVSRQAQIDFTCDRCRQGLIHVRHVKDMFTSDPFICHC